MWNGHWWGLGYVFGQHIAGVEPIMMAFVVLVLCFALEAGVGLLCYWAAAAARRSRKQHHASMNGQGDLNLWSVVPTTTATGGRQGNVNQELVRQSGS